MTFQSLEFILFFISTVFASFFLPKKTQKYVLLLANLAFVFFAGGIRTLCFISVTTLSTFFAAKCMGRTASPCKKRALLVLTLLLNVAFLVVLKYASFFVHTAHFFLRFFRAGAMFSLPAFIAPIGISFYTLWMVGYLLDVYWGSYEAEQNLADYVVFATYFPLIISGPIVRFPEMKRELCKERTLTTAHVSKGILRVCWGYFEKMVIADNIARIVNTIYADYGTYSGWYIVLGTVCFAMQLYTDFAGCMDIALGCSTILDISLPENFNTPFFSKSLSEFWRRWHITLGTWFKDYLMYPVLKSHAFIKLGDHAQRMLGKKKGKKVPVYAALFVLWFCVGFWHGGLWKYIIGSGLLHCFYIILGQVFADAGKKATAMLHINADATWWKCFQMLRTFILVCTGFVFFRGNGVVDALHIFRQLLVSCDVSLLSFLSTANVGKIKILVLPISLLVLFCVSVIKTGRGEALRAYGERRGVAFVISLVLVLAVYCFSENGNVSFIYFAF